MREILIDRRLHYTLKKILLYFLCLIIIIFFMELLTLIAGRIKSFLNSSETRNVMTVSGPRSEEITDSTEVVVDELLEWRDADVRYYTRDDIEGLSEDEIQHIINEICDNEAADYSKLNSYEIYNVKLLEDYLGDL